MNAASPWQLFTIHLWQEDLGGATEWRGKVQHVPSRQTHYFRDWPTLIAFLEACTAAEISANGERASRGLYLLSGPRRRRDA